MEIKIEDFFYKSTYLDMFVLKQLSHIKGNWDLSWNSNTKGYIIEDDSFGNEINSLIDELENTIPPKKYHDNEDVLADYVKANLNWNIEKNNNRWEGADYKAIIEQGGFGDKDEKNLILAATARIHTSIKLGQKCFDEMETGHMIMLANILSIILYHRYFHN